MAKVVIAGDVVVVTSSLKLDEIRTIERFRPSALNLMGGENNNEVVFAIGTTTGQGSITQHGACFGGESHTDEKLATVTLTHGRASGEVKEWIADNLGAAIINLKKLEEELPAVLETIKSERDEVITGIVVA